MTRLPADKLARRAWRPRRLGASILEMALTLAILLNLTFGTIEFGYFFFVKNTVQRMTVPPLL